MEVLVLLPSVGAQRGAQGFDLLGAGMTTVSFHPAFRFFVTAIVVFDPKTEAGRHEVDLRFRENKGSYDPLEILLWSEPFTCDERHAWFMYTGKCEGIVNMTVSGRLELSVDGQLRAAWPLKLRLKDSPSAT